MVSLKRFACLQNILLLWMCYNRTWLWSVDNDHISDCQMLINIDDISSLSPALSQVLSNLGWIDYVVNKKRSLLVCDLKFSLFSHQTKKKNWITSSGVWGLQVLCLKHTRIWVNVEGRQASLRTIATSTLYQRNQHMRSQANVCRKIRALQWVLSEL